MPDKNNQPGRPIQSRSAQSGQPDDKPRDRTQRGDETAPEDGQRTESGNEGDRLDEGESADRGQADGNRGKSG